MEEGVQRGIQLGIQQGLQQKEICLIKKYKNKGRSPEEIAGILEAELSFVNKIIDLINTHPDADDAELYTLWTAQKE